MRRLLVTRAAEDAAATARLIGMLGHEAVLAPLRSVEAFEAAPPAQPDALVATSANAFRFGSPIPPAWRGLAMFCVGEKTADAARAAGFAAPRVASGDVEALIALLRHDLPMGASLVYLAGEPRRETLERTFAGRITLWPRYRIVDAQTLPSVAARHLRTGQIDAVLHFSARSAQCFFTLVRDAGLLEEAARPRHACLSEAVAKSVRAFLVMDHIGKTVIARERTADSLVRAAICCPET